MILDQDGNLVWTQPYGDAYGLNVYTVKGKDYLTFWVGDDSIVGHGDGTYYFLNSSYDEVYKLGAANGLPADLHELHVTRDGTAVFTSYDVVPANLTSMYGPEEGWIYDGTFQEVDIETGELLFQWRASEHFDFTEAYVSREGTGEIEDEPWDFFHINSVDKDARGNFLISSRYMCCLAYIDGKTGEVIWKLGGKNNMFRDLSDGAATNISWQHHARFRDNDTAITLFDNSYVGNDGPKHLSRGLYLDVDMDKMTAKVRHEYWNPLGISSQSQGSLEILDSGNVLVGYGNIPVWTEYSIEGEVLCDVHFGPAYAFSRNNILSYRASKRPWVGLPKSDPSMILHGNAAYVSWNGATEVVTWIMQGADADGAHDSNYVFLAELPKKGFETVIPIPEDNTHPFLRVIALDAAGDILGSTATVKWDPAQDADKGSKVDTHALLFFFVGFICATLLALCSWGISSLVTLTRDARRRRKNHTDRLTARWKHADFYGGEEDLSEDDIGDTVEFSLLPQSEREDHATDGRR
ncbi:hypothetical protein VTN02DRAFT_1852 [Thermoascus thermophilus]